MGMNENSRRWLVERRKEIAGGRVDPRKHCVDYHALICNMPALCPCPSFNLNELLGGGGKNEK